MLTTMMMPTRSPLQMPLTRSSSQDLLDRQPPASSPSPTQPRSNSFVASRRAGIVSEHDVLRLAAAASFNGAIDNAHPPVVARQPSNPRGLPPRTTANQTAATSSPWPAPVLRQRSSDAVLQRRPRPLSTGYLLSSSSDSQVPRHTALDTVEAPLRLRNVPLLPNRQIIQRPGDNRWRQWNTAQMNDVASRSPVAEQSYAVADNDCMRQTQSRSSGLAGVDDRQQLDDREAELRSVRSTMERNETAILRALNDQRRVWEADVASERDAWARRLNDAEQLVDDVRRALTDRIGQLELENAALHSSSIESHHSYPGLHGHSGNDQRRHSPGDDLNRSRVNLVNGIDSITQSTRNFTSGSSTSSGFGSGWQPIELNGVSEAGAFRLPAIPEGPALTTRCQHCDTMRSELDRVRREFDVEREQWLTEKRRVIAYQKLIQSKYVQLARRCAAQLEGSSSIDGLNHLGVADDMVPSSDSRTPARPGLRSTSTQSNAPMSPRLIPFGQAIET